MNRKIVFLGIFLPVILAFTANATASDLTQVSLNMGDIQLLEVGEVVRLAVGDDEVVTATILDTGKMMLIPLKPGDTELVVWKTGERQQRYRVQVLASNMSDKKAIVDAILQNFDRVSSRIVVDKIVLEGMVDPTDVDGFEKLVASLENVISFVKPVPESKEMIRLKVQVLEVDKRYRKDLGIDWVDSAEGPLFGTIGTFRSNPVYRIFPENDLVDWREIQGLIPISDKDFYPYSGLATTLTSRLDFLQENGAGRILAEPNLSTRSGESATFLAGGEIPFPFTDSDGQTVVEFREYGVRLEILPTADGQGNIVSTIAAEVSSIDTAVTVLGVPGLLIRETESTVNIKPGDTIAISGLLSTNDTRNIDSIPLLGELPIIGALFRSESFQEQRTEIIFLVTTEIVDTTQQAVRSEKLQKHMDELREIRGNGGIFSEQLAD
ncbi:type II and III secretion system protein family protein [Arenicella xantha]|uniref:Pilus assembly protein CpaC n=1 Tax=Arenicella xantha TaxID=644221 RepID=A0A395JRQ8_9GAMM|nr:pilus assembly protein N-terminal domain-containing protein [Arenicella xantha]RBP51380.1 pilus assembly protein CpaC [Arenicella xantha]